MSIAISAQLASPKQIKFLTDLTNEYARLMRETDSFKNADGEQLKTYNKILDGMVEEISTLDRPTVSKNIDAMKESVQRLRLKARERQVAVAPVVEDLESGIYLNGSMIYKVYRGQSGRMLAKILMIDEPGDAHFEYAGLATRFVKPEGKMTLDQAKEYGAIYGVCCNCGRTLTDETSIEAGIGPVCAGKF